MQITGTKKKRVAILFGGNSNEYEISLRSVVSILEHIDTERFEISLIGITREGNWYLYSGTTDEIAADTWHKGSKIRPAFVSPSPEMAGIVVLSNENNYIVMQVDVIFPVLHGWGGEDGKVQGLLALSGLPYVGCDLAASHICMDKAVAHTLLEEAGVKTAKWITVLEEEKENLAEVSVRVAEELSYPVFVKPANSGSSKGVSRAESAVDLALAMHHAFVEDSKIVVEEAIEGREVECAVLGSGADAVVSTIGEIESGGFYDYDSKYVNDTATLSIPAKFSNEIIEAVRENSLKAYRTLGCEGLSRVDSFVKENGDIILNEINTLPGFTSISMYPKLMEHAGYSYRELLTKLIMLAEERAVQKK